MFRNCFVIFISLVIFGCASQPKSVILNPVYSAGKISDINMAIHASVIDHRITNFTIKVQDQEPAIYLPDASLPIKVNRLLSRALQSNGATLDKYANTHVTLQINTFHSKVTESISRHESNATADFIIIASQGKRRFEKQYKGQSQITGPLKHEQAKIENQLNNLTQKMITRIVSDKALVNFLQGHKS